MKDLSREHLEATHLLRVHAHPPLEIDRRLALREREEDCGMGVQQVTVGYCRLRYATVDLL